VNVAAAELLDELEELDELTELELLALELTELELLEATAALLPPPPQPASASAATRTAAPTECRSATPCRLINFIARAPEKENEGLLNPLADAAALSAYARRTAP
jgi:hypothetical protein